MKLNNVAFLTTIFPMEEQFLIDFFDSLSKQTYKNFDVIVVNDGYRGFDEIKERYCKLNLIELGVPKSELEKPFFSKDSISLAMTKGKRLKNKLK